MTAIFKGRSYLGCYKFDLFCPPPSKKKGKKEKKEEDKIRV